MLYLTQASIGLYFLADLSMVFVYFATNGFQCYLYQVFACTFYNASKTAMYCLFLTRLYSIYKDTQYAYSKKGTILAAAAIIIFWHALTIVISIIWVDTVGVHFYDNGRSFPNYCDASLELVSALMLTVEDSLVCAGFLAGFIIPLRKTLKAVTQSASIQDSKEIRKIQYLGFKTVILTAVAMFSCFFLVTMTTITNLNLFVGFDPIPNSICMLMMLPYKPDERYYQRYCVLCIFCCDKQQLSVLRKEEKLQVNKEKRGHDAEDTVEPTVTEVTRTNVSGQSDGSSMANSVSPTSVDTMDQLAHTAGNLKTDDQNATYDKVQDAVDDEEAP